MIEPVDMPRSRCTIHTGDGELSLKSNSSCSEDIKRLVEHTNEEEIEESSLISAIQLSLLETQLTVAIEPESNPNSGNNKL